MTSEKFIVICARVVGGDLTDFAISYSWDAQEFGTRDAAIAHGVNLTGSDDFNVGVVRDGRLAEFGWMRDPMHESDRPLLPWIAAEIGLRA